jgi:signal transduction histidine kinase
VIGLSKNTKGKESNGKTGFQTPQQCILQRGVTVPLRFEVRERADIREPQTTSPLPDRLRLFGVHPVKFDTARQAIDYRNPAALKILQDAGRPEDFADLTANLCGESGTDSFAELAHTNRTFQWGNRLLGCSIYPVSENHFCLFLRDITEKTRLESIAQAVNTMDNIGFIFSGIRHEIGNPLNSIKMTISVLRKNLDRFPKETIREYIERTASEITRMEYLLKSLRNFSHV